MVLLNLNFTRIFLNPSSTIETVLINVFLEVDLHEHNAVEVMMGDFILCAVFPRLSQALRSKNNPR